MPTYGYKCTQCGHEFEVIQGILEPPLRECPRCMGPLQKVLYPVGVIFKGSGFYSTDYKSSSRSEAGSAKADSDGASKDSKADSKTDSSPKTSSETRSETKSETKSDKAAS